MENISQQIGKYKTKPYDHQLRCLNLHGRKYAFALLAEMGTGKTWIIINNIADLWASGEIDGVIVFAPNGVHTNWTLLELGKHMPDWVRYRAAAWSSNANKKELASLESLFDSKDSTELRILTMNWEGLQHARSMEFAEKFCNSCSKLMIVGDEIDAVKNPTALRTKNLMKLRKFSKYRRAMTGTPVDGSPFSLFAPFTFLDEDILGTTSFYAFKAEYAEMLQPGNPLLDSIVAKTRSRFTPQVVAKGANGKPKYRNLDKLSKIIAPHSFRVLKADCLDLPEKIYKTVIFDMTPKQKAIYDKAKEECRLVFEGNETPFNKLAAMTKLAQITSGYYIHPLSEQPVRIEGDTPKLDLLVERVQAIIDQGKKVIIWARYRIEIKDIIERLKGIEGAIPVEYHGEIKKGDRIDAIEDFERGEANVFVGNQQAGGTGITLIAASYVIYFSNNFSMRDRLQSEDRAHRIGQTENVTYINIAAKGTIDEYVIRALSNKKDVADEIVDIGMAMFGVK
jgi:SNF2 family DNA or RNA helicase